MLDMHLLDGVSQRVNGSLWHCNGFLVIRVDGELFTGVCKVQGFTK